MTLQSSRWFFTWAANAPIKGDTTRGVLLKGARWGRGETITISFLDGEEALWNRVEAAARQWIDGPAHAKLKFEFRWDTTDTLVRISFRERGSWSALGTTCKQIKKDRPTMNFGWLDKDTPQEDLERVVLHEFGHVLGLGHEHQHPGGVIHWHREQIINELSGYPNYWTLDEIELNLFRPHAIGETLTSKPDRDSIMVYEIPERWTTDGYHTELNKKLSAGDIAFISSVYY